MRLIASLLCLLLMFGTAARAAAPALPALGADPARVSVSGLSSGGYMAAQYAVAFSGETIGAGVIAGGPYGCAAIYLFTYLSTCMNGSPDGATSFRSASYFARQGMIDPLENIRRQRIYLFSGTKDPVITPSVMNAVRSFYQAAGLPEANLLYEKAVPAGHAFISDRSGNPDCGYNGAPYVDRCTVGGSPYDQPGALLAHIHGPLAARAATLSAAPEPFDQRPFIWALSSMAETGYAYIPAACRTGAIRCSVHMVFHGCGQGADKVGDAIYSGVGYNQWAESNGMIILYPQVAPSLIPANPGGCWDWFGYTGTNYLFRTGAQIAAVHAMVARLTAPR